MASASPRASSLGQDAAQALAQNRPFACRGTASRLSSPAMAASGGGVADVSVAMTDDLLAQPRLDLDGQLDGLRVVHAARPGELHWELADDLARPAAQQHHPVAEPDCLAHFVRDEQDGQLA